MAIGDERDLRNRLGAVLDQVTPSPAPVGAVLRKGKVIRSRRRVGVAAGVAAVALAAAVAVPSLLDQPSRPAPVTRHRTPKVTVTRLSGHVAHGLIAQGTIDKKVWRITFDQASNNTLCIRVAGQVPECGSGSANAQSVNGFASMGSMDAVPRWHSLYGPVRRDVTRISIGLSDGTVLDLHPFASSGHRWIGLVIPGQLQMVEAIAYSGSRELGYSIPFIDKNGSAVFVRWLRPGETGPARMTRLIGSGIAAGQAWSVVGYAGPWGYCEVLNSPSDASSTCSQVTPQGRFSYGVDTTIGTAADHPSWVIGTAPPSVVYLRLTMSDRSTVRVPVVELAGVKYFALALTGNPRVVRWGAFDSAGREVLGGQGSLDRWKPKN